MNTDTEKLNKEPSEEEIKKLKQFINSNQLVNAEQKAKKLIKKHPDSYTLLNILGVSLVAQQKLDEAEKIYFKLINVKVDFAEAYNNLANIYMKKKYNDKAIYYLEKALSIKPNLNQAHFNLAKIHTETGNIQKLMQFQFSKKTYMYCQKTDTDKKNQLIKYTDLSHKRSLHSDKTSFNTLN